jgi:hypothetical protein
MIMNYTLIAYQEGHSYSDRCGDRYSHDGSLTIHCSADEQEIIELWSEYLFKNLALQEAEQEYSLVLLQNGVEYVDYYAEYYEFDANRDRIRALAESDIDKHLAKKKLKDEAEKKRADEEQAARNSRLAIAEEKSAHEKYLALHARFGGK